MTKLRTNYRFGSEAPVNDLCTHQTDSFTECLSLFLFCARNLEDISLSKVAPFIRVVISGNVVKNLIKCVYVHDLTPTPPHEIGQVASEELLSIPGEVNVNAYFKETNDIAIIQKDRLTYKLCYDLCLIGESRYN